MASPKSHDKLFFMSTDKNTPKLNFWQRITSAHPSIKSPTKRRFASVLSMLLLVFLPLYFLPESIRAIIEKHSLPEILYLGSGVLFLSAAYIFARSPHPRWGSRLTILYFSLLPFATLFVKADRYAGDKVNDVLIWTIPVMLLVLIIVPPKQVKFVIFAHIGFYLIIPVLWDGLTHRQVLSTLWLAISVGALVIISAYVQERYLEQARREAQQNKISERRFREIFLSSPVALWEADFSKIKQRLDALAAEHGTDLMNYVLENPEVMEGAGSSALLLDANQVAIELYGADSLEVLKKSWHLVVTEEAMLSLRDGVINLWQGTGNRPVETIHQTLDGGEKDVVVRFSLRSGYEDTWERINISISDITERRAAEASMRQLASAVESSASSIVVTNLRGRIEYTNPAFTDITGYTKEEAIGQDTNLLKSGMHDQEFYDHLWKTISQGETWRGELINRRKDGSLYWESQVISAVKNQVEEITHYVAVKDDITQTKEAEEQLRNLSNATEQTASGVVITDLEGRVQYVNPAFSIITGYTQEEVIGETLEIQKSGEHEQYFYDQLDETIARGETWTGEIINRRKDGSLYWEAQVISPVKNDDGEVTHYVYVKENITRRKELEQALALAHEEALVASDMKTQLLANVSHDMRTPLGAILGYTEMLDTGVFSPLNAEQAEATRAIASSSQRLLDFVNNLLSQAQIDTGKIILNKSLFKPQKLFDGLGGEFSLARTQGLTVETTIDQNLPEKIRGDSYWLGQVLHNLVSNAIKFTPREGKIDISLFKDSETTWALEVSDNGKGIPPKAQSYIFESFRQVDGSPTRESHTGSGLGLSIVNHLARLMQGEIKLESEEGKGSVFTVLLPLHEIEAE